MQYFDLIHDFMEGRMDEAAQRDFRARLGREPALKAEYDAFQAAVKLSADFGADALKKTLGKADATAGSLDADEANFEGEGKKPLSTRTLFLVAASLVFLVFIGLFMVSKLSTPNKETLFVEAYEMPFFDTKRSVSDEKSPLYQAKTAFYDKNYALSIAQIQSAEGKILALPSTQALLAHSYLLNKKPELALSVFDKLAIINSPEWSPSAPWYAALSALKMGDKTETKKRLLDLSKKSENGYAEKAKALLEEL